MSKRTMLWTASLVALLAAAPVLAQEKGANFERVYVSSPKPGMTQQLEEGRKRHMKWHKSAGDTWNWDVYQVQTGEATGNYIVVTGGHTWKDFDAWEAKYAAADTSDGEKNLTPYSNSLTNGFWMEMGKVSNPSTDTTPAKMIEVIHFVPKQDGEREFNAEIAKIDGAIKKTKWPVNYTWHMLVNGGDQPHYVLVIPRKGFTDMEEPTPSFEDMLAKALGPVESKAVMQSLGKATLRQWSEILTYRPDLSSRPGM